MNAHVDLFWLPLGSGAGSGLVRLSGRAFEVVAAARSRRPRRALFHSALEVQVDGGRWIIEMTPDWSRQRPGRDVLVRGPVGWAPLGGSRLFRYEVHLWKDGVVDDAEAAVESPLRLSCDPERARRLLELVPEFPAFTWGRDPQGTGDMWNSNSLSAWLLARSGHDTDAILPPAHGRAPGWSAGLVVARRRQVTAPTRRRRSGSGAATRCCCRSRRRPPRPG